ncbi:MAG TPA: TetR/AcrR family transcriptional regulator [Bradyrhizobium sp.]|nr:TetR/AcrR family transcriptional regulator [Bradyrhizobium sp.]
MAHATRAFIDARDPPAKGAILSASLKLFVRDGITETSIRDIAKEGGYTNPALFRHFESKEALAYYLFERIFLHLRASLPKIDDGPFTDQLRRTLKAYLTLLDEDIEAALYYQENIRQFWRLLPEPLRRHSPVNHMRSLLKCGVEQNVIDRREDLTLLVAALLGLIGQLGRMCYFREFSGRPQDRLDELHRLASRMLLTAR